MKHTIMQKYGYTIGECARFFGSRSTAELRDLIDLHQRMTPDQRAAFRQSLEFEFGSNLRFGAMLLDVFGKRGVK